MRSRLLKLISIVSPFIIVGLRNTRYSVFYDKIPQYIDIGRGKPYNICPNDTERSFDNDSEGDYRCYPGGETSS